MSLFCGVRVFIEKSGHVKDANPDEYEDALKDVAGFGYYVWDWVPRIRTLKINDKTWTDLHWFCYWISFVKIGENKPR